LARVTLLYVLAIAAAAAVLWLMGDRSWISLPLLYGPRWLLAAPLLLLVPAAIALKATGSALGLTVAAAAIAGPIAGFQLSPRALSSGDAPRDLRVLTHNLGRLSPTSPRFAAVLDQLRPDVALLQECVPEGDAAELTVPGWFTHYAHQMCLLSKHPIVSAEERDRTDVWARGGSGAIVLYTIETPIGRVQLLNLHLETPRDSLIALRHGDVREAEDNLAQRTWESQLAREWADRATEPVIVGGDLNMTEESALYRSTWRGFTNAFGEAGLGYGDTKSTRWYGARIDHILLARGWECTNAWVGPETGSDHTPMIAEIRRTN
jgi:endonuclease/exonuclease/phosphatase (EEP) superfamily protein YafD